MDGIQLPQGWSHFEEVVYFLPLKVAMWLEICCMTVFLNFRLKKIQIKDFYIFLHIIQNFRRYVFRQCSWNALSASLFVVKDVSLLRNVLFE